MNYHIARYSQQLGVFSKEDTLARYNRGEFLPTDLVWTDGMATWQPASQIFGAPVPPVVTPPDAPPAQPPVLDGQPDTLVVQPSASAPGNPFVSAAAPSAPVAAVTPVAAAVVAPPKPETHLVWAILSTLLCCLPLGVVAIIFAAQVDGKYAQGDYAGAAASSRKAKLFSIWSCVLGLVYIAGVAIFLVISMAMGASGRY